MTERDQAGIFSLNGDSGESEHFGAYDDFAATENSSADSLAGLVSLGFIKEAISRSARLLFVLTVVGMLVGVAAYVESPHEYQAAASMLITLTPFEDSQTVAVNNQAIAMTPAVAGLAVQELGLHQSASSFLSTYSVASVTSRLITVTASAPSAAQAVSQASAVASAFLKFRANDQQAQETLVLGSLDQQISQAKQRLNAIDAQINQVSNQPASPTQQSQLIRLRTEQSNETGTLDSFTQSALGSETTTQADLTAALKHSEILTVAPLPHSRLKRVATYAGIGLIAGLALGLTIIIVRALVSNRLRRRDDIAYALDAPVKLSVGPLHARRWRPNVRDRAKRELGMRRVIAHLQRAVPRGTNGPAGLAIVAVDNAPIVARAVADLVTSCASHGNRVVAADLSSGAHLAHLLGVKNPGVQPVSRDGVNFMVAVPDRDDAAPVGPRRAGASPAGSAPTHDALVASYASADVLLTLVTLDPALGGDYLGTWATNAVVVVSAGQSSAERVHGVGEMIRLAGTRLDSVVLLGADKSDESLGLTRRSDEQVDVGALGR